MLISKLLKIIEEKLPAETALEGDKIGLQVQGGNDEINRILVTLEVTDDVIEEAGQLDCDCIITFHPLIYNSLTAIINSERVGNLCHQLIKKSITLIVVHTTFDVFSEGTSKILAEKLGLELTEFLIPDKKYKNKGMGVIATTNNSISPNDLLERVYQICNSPIRFTIPKNITSIDKIAIIGGSGSSFMQEAINSGAKAFITADITYHRFHDVYNKIMLIDPGHYEMEQFVPEGLANLLINNIEENEIDKIFTSKSFTNPVRYYPDLDIYEAKQKKYLLNKHKG